MSFNIIYDLSVLCHRTIPHGLAVRISGFHPGGPGSTPGVGRFFWPLKN